MQLACARVQRVVGHFAEDTLALVDALADAMRRGNDACDADDSGGRGLLRALDTALTPRAGGVFMCLDQALQSGGQTDQSNEPAQEHQCAGQQEPL